MLRHVVLPVSAIVITIPKGGYGFSQRSCANHRAVVEAHQKPVQRGAMRPSLLDPLFAALTTLPGVGPKLEKLYRRLFGREETPARIIDLLFHLPTGTIDRRSRPKLRDVVPGSVVTVAGTVDRSEERRVGEEGRSR